MELEIFTDKTIIVDTNIIWNAASGGVENHSELNLDDGTNPHGTTKTDVGLSDVDNTADIEKNVLTAQKLIFKVKATEDILKGQAVTYSGYNQGQDAIEVTLADETIANGLATENINNGAFGYIIQSGQLTDVDTSNWSNGTILYTATNGNLTDVEPTEYDAQPIAFVLRSNQNNGALQVNADYPKQDAYDVRYDNNNSVGDILLGLELSQKMKVDFPKMVGVVTDSNYVGISPVNGYSDGGTVGIASSSALLFSKNEPHIGIIEDNGFKLKTLTARYTTMTNGVNCSVIFVAKKIELINGVVTITRAELLAECSLSEIGGNGILHRFDINSTLILDKDMVVECYFKGTQSNTLSVDLRAFQSELLFKK